MLFPQRFHTALNCESLGFIAHELARFGTMTCCTGYRWEQFLFLNDATCEDGAQEYAVLRLDEAVQRELTRPLRVEATQIESLTLSWFESKTKDPEMRLLEKEAHVLKLLQQGVNSSLNLGNVMIRIEGLSNHSCSHCE